MMSDKMNLEVLIRKTTGRLQYKLDPFPTVKHNSLQHRRSDVFREKTV